MATEVKKFVAVSASSAHLSSIPSNAMEFAAEVSKWIERVPEKHRGDAQIRLSSDFNSTQILIEIWYESYGESREV